MLRHIIIILALTLNLAVNQLHAADDEFPDWTELPPLLDNNDPHPYSTYSTKTAYPATVHSTVHWTDDKAPQKLALQQASQLPNDGYHSQRTTISTPPASSLSSQYAPTKDGWLGYGAYATASNSSPYPENFNRAMLQNLTSYSFLNTLAEGMWGTGDYQLPLYEHNGDANQLTPLTKEMVSTPFFVTLEGATVEERTTVLDMAAYHPNNSESYIIRRYNMTAIIHSGPVNIPAIQKRRKKDDLWNGFLVETTFNNDLFLAQLLLENGADVHERNSLFSRTPIFFARTVPFARLLIKHGALNHPLCIKDLLRSAASFKSPDFITEYIANGLDPMVRSEYGHTPLTGCIEDPQELTSQNALCLLAHLPAHKIRTLLNNPSCERESVFECITRKKKSYKKKPYYREKRAQLKALFTVLMKAGIDAGMPAEMFEDCPLCLGMLCKQAMRTTLCGHTFHSQCIGSLTICPMCRATVMTADAEQHQKNEMLFGAYLKTPGNEVEQRQKWRENIIKALKLGADIKVVQRKFTNDVWWEIGPLQHATNSGDVELMQQMIESGANIHEYGFEHSIPIFLAYNLPEAELLVSYGALNHPSVQQHLLFELSDKQYQPELITFYRKLGLKPIRLDMQGMMSILMHCVRDISADTLDRIQRMLKGLSAQEVSAIIALQDAQNKTVFDYIERKKKDFEGYRPDILNQLDLIEQYLRAVEKDPSLPSKEAIS